MLILCYIDEIFGYLIDASQSVLQEYQLLSASMGLIVCQVLGDLLYYQTYHLVFVSLVLLI